MSKSVCFIAFIALVSCNTISRVAYRIEETHYALYQQKALLVLSVEDNKVWFVNPTYTRCYFLKGKFYVDKWIPGDTMVIENNLEDFYQLKHKKNCNLL